MKLELKGEAWARETNLVVISKVAVFKAMSLDEITEEMRVDGKEVRSSPEPWGTWVLRGEQVKKGSTKKSGESQPAR